jgi:predicted regulator of Ras-like GTPase activity (Roadblock/LC7/MglB family)
MAASSNLDRASADKMAAIVSGLRSLSDGASRVLAKGAVSQVVVEMRNGFLFASAISGGSSLGVIARRDCDLGLVGYEMTLLVERFGHQLTPELIAELKASLSL